MTTVTLYTKPDCPLCDEAKHALALLARAFDLTLVERNILDDPADFARFRYLIPVVDIAGGPLLTPPHDLETLRAGLCAAAPAAASGARP